VGKFNPATVRLVTHEIRQMIGKIERGEVHPRYAVSFISDMEQSLLESELDKAVNTDIVEVQNNLRELSQQTWAHRDLLRMIWL
jgi:hypothetical protein